MVADAAGCINSVGLATERAHWDATSDYHVLWRPLLSQLLLVQQHVAVRLCTASVPAQLTLQVRAKASNTSHSTV